MSIKSSVRWMTLVGIIGIVFGVFYALFGLEGLPAYRILVAPTALSPWSNGLYGSVFIGFSVLLLFAGRHAFQSNDKTLMKILLCGVASWLTAEAIFSLVYGVYFNIGVDVALMALLGYPLIRGIKATN